MDQTPSPDAAARGPQPRTAHPTDQELLKTLFDLGRQVAAVLDLDELLHTIPAMIARLVDFQAFAAYLLDEKRGELSVAHAVGYPPGVAATLRLKIGQGLVGTAVAEGRPLLVKDRCIGVFDLESPELDAFSKAHQEILTLLASQAAVAIENARLYEAVRANEVRIESELHFAQRVQMALLPAGLPKRMKGVEVVARLAPARELIRSRTFRRRYAPEPASPSGVLASINTILHERELFEYYCTLCYAQFDLKRRTVALANSGLPYPIRCAGDRCEAIELAGVPLGSFAGSSYDDLQLDLHGGDLFVFYTDGVPEALDAEGREFGTARLIETVHAARGGKAQAVVDAIFDTVHAFRGNAPPGDDMTAVVVRLMI